MFMYLKSLLGGKQAKRAKPKRARSLTGHEEFTVADSFLWGYVIPIGLVLMINVTFAIFISFLVLAVTGKL